MNFIEFRKALIVFPVFSYSDIYKVDPEFDRRRLVEWQAKNYIKKIRKGYYYFPEREINENFLMHISNKIYKPSYISMATALSYYNLIPEGVYLITGISTRKTILFETPLGNFGYRTVKKELFFGYRLIQQGDYNIRYAEVEKSVLDFFYFNKINDIESLEALRLNRLVAKEIIQKDKLLNYLSVFNSRIMDQRIKLLLNYLNA